MIGRGDVSGSANSTWTRLIGREEVDVFIIPVACWQMEPRYKLERPTDSRTAAVRPSGQLSLQNRLTRAQTAHACFIFVQQELWAVA
jgi:hypothetical protein